MRIAVDARPLLEPRPGGVRFAARGMIRSLVDAGADVTLWTNSRNGSRDADLAGLDGARVIAGRIPNKALNASLLFRRRPRLDDLAGNPEWFLMPNPNFAAFSPDAKLALVIHDLSFEVNRSWFSPRQRLWHRMVNPRALARRADRIIAVSENTKRDLVDLYGLALGKIVVVPPTFGRRSFDKLRMTSDVVMSSSNRDQFILYLGEITRRKNILGLIRAFESLAAKYPDLRLVVAGPDGWGAKEVRRAIAASSVHDRIEKLGQVSEEAKRDLLRRAAVFVYPSFYEGFGLPVVEAMSVGTPVVASQAGSLPEVVGDAGLLIDPYDVSTIREAVSALLASRPLADSYARRGLDRAAEWVSGGEPKKLLAVLQM